MARLASPDLTGTPTAPTPSADDDSTQIATTEYVQAEITGLGGGAASGFTELRAPATLSVATTWTATGAIIPDVDGDEWVRMNGNFDGEVPENFEFLSSRLRVLAEHIVGGSTSTGDVERLQFHDGSVFQRVLMARTSSNEIILRHESDAQSLGNLSIYSYSSIAAGAVAFSSKLVFADYTSGETLSSTTGDPVLRITDDSINFNHGGFTVTTENDFSRVAVPEAGIYEVQFAARYGTVSTASSRRMSLAGIISVNETDTEYYYGFSSYLRGVAITENPTVGASVLVELAAGDTVSARIAADGQESDQTYGVVSAYSHFSIHKLGGGAAGEDPGEEVSDSSLDLGQANTLDATDIDVPTGTWSWINPGVITDASGNIRVGGWERFLVADLTGLTDSADGDTATDSNTISFDMTGTGEHYRIGKTSGGKITVATSSADFAPSEIRVRD